MSNYKIGLMLCVNVIMTFVENEVIYNEHDMTRSKQIKTLKHWKTLSSVFLFGLTMSGDCKRLDNYLRRNK